MSTTPAKITLRSSDGELFEVDEAVAVQSQAIKHLIDDQCADNVVPLPNVTGPILAKVIQYCKKHAEAGDTNDGDAKPADESLTNWDADFINVDQVTLVDLILAANYLNIKNLLGLACQAVADIIAAMSTEEIRRAFNIKNDFSPEEEEEVRRESQWAYR